MTCGQVSGTVQGRSVTGRVASDIQAWYLDLTLCRTAGLHRRNTQTLNVKNMFVVVGAMLIGGAAYSQTTPPIHDAGDPVAASPIVFPGIEIATYNAELHTYSNAMSLRIEHFRHDYMVEFRFSKWTVGSAEDFSWIYYNQDVETFRTDARLTSGTNGWEIDMLAGDLTATTMWLDLITSPHTAVPTEIEVVYGRNQVELERVRNAIDYWQERVAVDDVVLLDNSSSPAPWMPAVGGVALGHPCDTTPRFEGCCVLTYGTGSACSGCCDTYLPSPHSNGTDCNGYTDNIACCLAETAHDACRRMCNNNPFSIIGMMLDATMCARTLIGITG